jgi:hypothetical protein
MSQRLAKGIAMVVQVAQLYFPHINRFNFTHLFKLQARTVYDHLQSTKKVKSM